MTILEITNLNQFYGSRKAVDGISFTIQEGEVFGLLGPNGAGKSTTLSLICGLLKPKEGSVVIGGWNLKEHINEAKALIGLVPQEPALYPHLSARTNLKFWGALNGVKKGELNQRIVEVLKLVGLEDRGDERVKKFSGGMKRRLNIAAGLIHNPKLLIMDEPTVGVDPQSRNHILETVKRLKEQGTTTIYTSHYVEEVEYLCDRVAIMDHGKVITSGTISELLRDAGEYQELEITLNRPSEKIVHPIEALPGVKGVYLKDRTLKIITSNAEQILPMSFEAIVNYGLQISEIKIHKPNLESLFLKLTGRALRDC